MIVELEGLQVFPVNDGADGLVLVSWIERYSSSEVRPVPRSMTVSREQANLLADELAKATDALGKDKAQDKPPFPIVTFGEGISEKAAKSVIRYLTGDLQLPYEHIHGIERQAVPAELKGLILECRTDGSAIHVTREKVEDEG